MLFRNWRLLPRALSMLAAVVLVATMGAAPVGARSDAFVFSQDGNSITQGTEPACTALPAGGSVCTSMMSFLFEGRWRAQNTGNPAYPDGLHIGDRVCLEFDTETRDAFGNQVDFVFEFGCPQATGNLTFNGLQSATLLPTTIVLEHSVTGATRTVVVAGQWTANGPESRTRSRERTREATCFSVSSENTRSRPAAASVTIDGAPLQVDFATLTQGRTKFTTTCF